MIYVAGALMVMAVVAAEIRNTSRRTVMMQGLEYTLLRQSLAADSISRLAGYLYSVDPMHRHAICVYNDMPLAYSVYPASGLLDLNTIMPDRLEAVLTRLSVDPGTARTIAAGFEQYRLISTNEAEATIFGEAGYFQHINQLRSLPGMTDMVFDTLRPYITVDAFAPSLNIEAAPALLRDLSEQSGLNPAQSTLEAADWLDKDEALQIEIRFIGTEFVAASSRYYAFSEAINPQGRRQLKHSYTSNKTLGHYQTERLNSISVEDLHDCSALLDKVSPS
ncbi:MAG: type II secretion system protein GspK [Henriciella sp.]|nr:type II secretion system protein GspK [Henriciella sp.]